MSVEIQEITTKQDLIKFIKFPDNLYSGSKYYLPAIHKAEIKTLDNNTNPAFEFCNARYWLVYKNNEIAGRIAGIINHNYNKKTGHRYIRFGWFDFIEDEDVVQLLLDAVERWGVKNNVEYVHGPLGFTSFDASGILIEGFSELPTSFAHYNYPYYANYIENLGYKKDVDWLEYKVTFPASFPPKYMKIAELVKKKYNLHTANLRTKKDLLGYSDEIFNLLNKEYRSLYGFTEFTKKQIEDLKKRFIPFLRKDYVSIVLDSDNQMVGFGISMPSLSLALQKSKGKLFPFGILRIMKALRSNDTVDSLLIAIQKDYQEKGINAIIFNEIGISFIKNGITNIESTRELEGNFKVSNLWNKFEYRQHKRARCYTKQLNNGR